ncbi:hypothetical protein MQX03_19495 [Chryseobacterium aahli]|uniref:hypothetical protein n=1 Tax=Chryseobacterium aahli TaxID=1278643 RepID=UPI001F61DCD0|nr:hypothetical protein [Chryseobacterium aahli]MCI3939365.1 hypothetical protein [Chryseobacterium aahli]
MRKHEVDMYYVEQQYNSYHGRGRFTVTKVSDPDKNGHRTVEMLCNKHNQHVTTNTDYKSLPSNCSGCFSDSNTKYNVTTIQKKSLEIFGEKYKIVEYSNGMVHLDCLLHFKQNITQTLNHHFAGDTPNCEKCREEKKYNYYLERRNKIIRDTFEDLHRKYNEGLYFFEPIEVFFDENNIKKVLVACPIHKDSNGDKYKFSIPAQKSYIKEISKKCPECNSKTQSVNRSNTVKLLKNKIRNSANETIKNNHFFIGFQKDKNGNIVQDSHGNNYVFLGCNILGHSQRFSQLSCNVGEQNGCSDCNNKRANRKSAEDYIVKIKNKLEEAGKNEFFQFNNLIDRDKNNRIKFNLICKICECPDWSYAHHIKNITCKNCNSKDSKGEAKIKLFLQLNHIKFEEKKRFDHLRNKLPLECDFYLPERNLIIEFDGLQHFKPIEFFKGEAKYFKNIENDKIKNEYCRNNCINLLRIPFYEFDACEQIISESIEILKGGGSVYKIHDNTLLKN